MVISLAVVSIVAVFFIAWVITDHPPRSPNKTGNKRAGLYYFGDVSPNARMVCVQYWQLFMANPDRSLHRCRGLSCLGVERTLVRWLLRSLTSKRAPFRPTKVAGERCHWAAPVSPTRLVNFITISLRGALMKPALTLATLIALDGTDHVQQGVISASAISPQKRRKRSWMRLRHRYANPGRQNTIGQSLQQ